MIGCLGHVEVYPIKVFATWGACDKCTKFSWVGKSTPTQGQPNPTQEKLGLKSGSWAAFSHSKDFFRGLGLAFYIGNRQQET